MKKAKVFILLFVSFGVFAQNGNVVFNDTVLHKLYIETDLVNWFDTIEYDYKLNISNPDLYPQRYFKCKVTFDGTVLNDCGFREKGNASNLLTNFSKKKPFKVSFDEFVNQNLDGLKKINLNNFTNDPSLVHDVLCYKLMRDVGVFASRTSFTKLWINGEFIGLYYVIENVDKTFLKFKYGSSQNDGNLYKTDRGVSVTLKWLGNDKEAYRDQGLKLNTNETADDWTGIINFIDFLNNNTDADFKQQLEKRFDVHAYLKILAVEKCVRSWDSYWGGGNNFYLYDHPDGKVRWIPWDMNESFQDLKVLSGTSLLDGYLVPANQFDERPLLKKIFEYEDWRNEYLNNVCDLIQNQFTLNHLGKFAVDRQNLIDSAYKADPNKYNSYESFKYSLTETNSDEVSISKSAYILRLRYPGIFPFIESQRKWAVKQIEAWDRDCSIEDKIVYGLNVFPNPAADYINISNDFSGFEYAQYKLYDFTGKLCRITNYEIMTGNYFTIQLVGIPSGIYWLVKNSADGKVGRAKIIIQ